MTCCVPEASEKWGWYKPNWFVGDRDSQRRSMREVWAREEICRLGSWLMQQVPSGLSHPIPWTDKTRTWPGRGCGSAGIAETIELSCWMAHSNRFVNEKQNNTIPVTFVLYHFGLYGNEGSFFPPSAQSPPGWSREAVWDGGRALGQGTAGPKSPQRVLLALCWGIYLVGLFSLHSPHYKKTEGICTFSDHLYSCF